MADDSEEMLVESNGASGIPSSAGCSRCQSGVSSGTRNGVGVESTKLSDSAPMCSSHDEKSDASQPFVRKMLLSKVCEIGSKEGDINEACLMDALNALDGMNVTTDQGSCASAGEVDGALVCDGVVPVDCPPRTLTGGRLPSTGLKAWQSRCKRARAKKSSGTDLLAHDWPEEECAPARKRKTIAEIMAS